MIFTWSPIKAQHLPSKRKHIDTILDDPRLAKYRNMKGYNDHVRNTMVNDCSSTSMDISLRYIYPCSSSSYLSREVICRELDW